MAAAAKAPAKAPAYTCAEGSRKVLADEVAKVFQQEIKDSVEACPGGVVPKLVGLLANADPASRKYAEWTQRTFERDGLRYELREVEQEGLEQALEEANQDPDVRGIMIYYPVFGSQPCFHGPNHDDFLRDCISPAKDVEGLCHFYRHSLYKNKRTVGSGDIGKCVLPCTPLACVKFLEHLGAYDVGLPVGDRLRGKHVTIVNRSEVVGRPLAAMLANDGATVYSIDIDSTYTFQRGTLNLAPEGDSNEDMVRRSDVVILAVPTDRYKMDPSWIKEGAIVVNVASHKNIDEAELLSTRPGVRFVGQVGKVTVALLERNLLRLHQNFDLKAEGRQFSAIALGHPTACPQDAKQVQGLVINPAQN
jgi:methylenetetrahydrofolate dehydrogenase (NAD+)